MYGARTNNYPPPLCLWSAERGTATRELFAAPVCRCHGTARGPVLLAMPATRFTTVNIVVCIRDRWTPSAFRTEGRDFPTSPHQAPGAGQGGDDAALPAACLPPPPAPHACCHLPPPHSMPCPFHFHAHDTGAGAPGLPHPEPQQTTPFNILAGVLPLIPNCILDGISRLQAWRTISSPACHLGPTHTLHAACLPTLAARFTWVVCLVSVPPRTMTDGRGFIRTGAHTLTTAAASVSRPAATVAAYEGRATAPGG